METPPKKINRAEILDAAADARSIALDQKNQFGIDSSISSYEVGIEFCQQVLSGPERNTVMDNPSFHLIAAELNEEAARYYHSQSNGQPTERGLTLFDGAMWHYNEVARTLGVRDSSEIDNMIGFISSRQADLYDLFGNRKQSEIYQQRQRSSELYSMDGPAHGGQQPESD
jgi:hypothetical protein